MSNPEFQFTEENIQDALKKLSAADLAKMSDDKRGELITALETKLGNLTETDGASGLKAKTVFRQILSDIRRLDLDKTEGMTDTMQNTSAALEKLGKIEMDLNTSPAAQEAMKAFDSYGEGIERNRAIINAQKGVKIEEMLAADFPDKKIEDLTLDELRILAQKLSEERFDLIYKKGGLIDQASSDSGGKIAQYTTFQELLSTKEREAQHEAIEGARDPASGTGSISPEEKKAALERINPDFEITLDENGAIIRTHKEYGFTEHWNDESGWYTKGDEGGGDEGGEVYRERTEAEKIVTIIADDEIPEGELHSSFVDAYSLDSAYTYTKNGGMLLRENDAGVEYYDTDAGEWKNEGERQAQLAEARKLTDPKSQEYKDNMKKNLGILTNYEGDFGESVELPIGVTFDEDAKTLVNADKTQWWNPESSAWETIDGSQEGSPYNTKQLNDLADAAKGGSNLGDGVTMAGEGIEQDGENIVRKVGHTTERWNTENGGSWETYTGEVKDKVLPDGKTKYTGHIKEGKPEGEGLVKLGSGATIKGIFTNGELSGNAIYTLSNGDTYEGIFEKDYQADPTREYTYTQNTTGYIEKGFFNSKWELNGKGVRRRGAIIEEGEFENGVFKKGFIEQKHDGKTWKREGMFDGTKLKGKITYPNGDTYEGQFDGFNLYGSGNIIYANGNKFSGEFANDKKEGEGTLYVSSGDFYMTASYTNDVIGQNEIVKFKNKDNVEFRDEWGGSGGANFSAIKNYAHSVEARYKQNDYMGLSSSEFRELTLSEFTSEYDDMTGSETAKQAAKIVLPNVQAFLDLNPHLKDKKISEIAALVG